MKSVPFCYYDTNGDVYTFIVKKEFLTICPNPENYSRQELNYTFKLIKYLHCLTGPAVMCSSRDYYVYCIDGKVYEDLRAWQAEAKHQRYDEKIESLLDV